MHHACTKLYELIHVPVRNIPCSHHVLWSQAQGTQVDVWCARIRAMPARKLPRNILRIIAVLHTMDGAICKPHPAAGAPNLLPYRSLDFSAFLFFGWELKTWREFLIPAGTIIQFKRTMTPSVAFLYVRCQWAVSNLALYCILIERRMWRGMLTSSLWSGSSLAKALP